MRYLIISIGTCSFLIIYISSFIFRFYSHFILNIFVHGVSGGKVYFFLIYTTLVFIYLFITEKKQGWHKIHHARTIKAFVFLMFLNFFTSLIPYLYYIKKFNLSIAGYHYHFKGVYNSVNYFPHIHTTKLFIYKIGNILGMGHLLRGMDDGRVFVDVIPNFFAYMTLFVVLSVLFLSFPIINAIVNDWEDRFRIGVSILSVLSFNSVIKCLSDGGPFSYDFLVGLGIIATLIKTKNPNTLISFIKKRWRVFFWIAFGIISMECFIDSSFGIAIYTLKNGITILSVYTFIYLIIARKTFKKGVFFLLFIINALFISYTVYDRYNIYIKPFHKFLDVNTAVHYFYYKDAPLPRSLNKSQLKYDTDFMSIYNVPFNKGERIIDLYKGLGENPYRNRHIAIMGPKKRQAYGIYGNITFIKFEDRSVLLKLPKIFYLKLKNKDVKRDIFNVEMVFDVNYFPVLAHAEEGAINQIDENHKFLMYYFLNRLFKYFGIDEYIFTPLVFYRFN